MHLLAFCGVYAGHSLGQIPSFFLHTNLHEKAAIKTVNIFLMLACQVNNFRMTGGERERRKIVHALKGCSQQWKEA